MRRCSQRLLSHEPMPWTRFQLLAVAFDGSVAARPRRTLPFQPLQTPDSPAVTRDLGLELVRKGRWSLSGVVHWPCIGCTRARRWRTVLLLWPCPTRRCRRWTSGCLDPETAHGVVHRRPWPRGQCGSWSPDERLVYGTDCRSGLRPVATTPSRRQRSVPGDGRYVEVPAWSPKHHIPRGSASSTVTSPPVLVLRISVPDLDTGASRQIVITILLRNICGAARLRRMDAA